MTPQAPITDRALPTRSAHGGIGPIVYRTWRLVPGPGPARAAHPLLAGLNGTVWRDQEVQARCDEGRRHRFVPDPRCTCGLYARIDSVDPQARRLPASRPLAAGFVEIVGRFIVEGDIIRAEGARVVGPIRLLTPRRPMWRQSGLPSQVRAVGGDYLVLWGRDGRRFDDWRGRAAAELSRRYGVEVA